jgi:hypothetical protein
MKRICSWILVAVTVGVLTACAGMSTSVYESTAVDPVSIPPSVGD